MLSVYYGMPNIGTPIELCLGLSQFGGVLGPDTCGVDIRPDWRIQYCLPRHSRLIAGGHAACPSVQTFALFDLQEHDAA